MNNIDLLSFKAKSRYLLISSPQNKALPIFCSVKGRVNGLKGSKLSRAIICRKGKAFIHS